MADFDLTRDIYLPEGLLQAEQQRTNASEMDASESLVDHISNEKTDVVCSDQCSACSRV